MMGFYSEKYPHKTDSEEVTEKLSSISGQRRDIADSNDYSEKYDSEDVFEITDAVETAAEIFDWE